jgi:DNA-binding NarL/FixJ family response regulator
MRVAIFTNSIDVLESIKTKLSTAADIQVVGTAQNRKSILAVAGQTKPDVIIIDAKNLIRPIHDDLIHLVEELRNLSENIQFIIATKYSNVHRNTFARSIGVKGFCLNTIGGEELIKAVRIVANGESFAQKEYDAALRIKEYLQKRYNLRERQADVLTLMLLGHSNEEIAGFLHVSYDTVRSHVKTILGKIGANDRAEVIAVVYIDMLNALSKDFTFLQSLEK